MLVFRIGTAIEVPSSIKYKLNVSILCDEPHYFASWCAHFVIIIKYITIKRVLKDCKARHLPLNMLFAMDPQGAYVRLVAGSDRNGRHCLDKPTLLPAIW